MSSIDEIRDARIKKLELLKARGINPYPAESKRELTLNEVVISFEDLEKNNEEKWVSGRIMSIRGQGAIVFLTLNDGTGTFQALLKKDSLQEYIIGLFMLKPFLCISTLIVSPEHPSSFPTFLTD